MSAKEILEKQSGRKSEQSTGDEVKVSFSREVYEALEEIARKKDKSVTEVIEDALGLEQWYLRTREEGGRIIVEHKNGDMWEIVHD